MPQRGKLHHLVAVLTDVTGMDPKRVDTIARHLRDNKRVTTISRGAGARMTPADCATVLMGLLAHQKAKHVPDVVDLCHRLELTAYLGEHADDDVDPPSEESRFGLPERHSLHQAITRIIESPAVERSLIELEVSASSPPRARLHVVHGDTLKSWTSVYQDVAGYNELDAIWRQHLTAKTIEDEERFRDEYNRRHEEMYGAPAGDLSMVRGVSQYTFRALHEFVSLNSDQRETMEAAE